jgi:hypothetical protein
MVIPQGDCQPAFPGTFLPQLHPTHIPAKHALGLDPRVDTGSPMRICVSKDD